MSGLAVLRDFPDQWRGKPADCLLLGQGPGPEGELVRLVFRKRPDGVDLFYLRSYEQGRGHARTALQFLGERFGCVHIQEATSDAMSFHEAMLTRGVISSITPQ